MNECTKDQTPSHPHAPERQHELAHHELEYPFPHQKLDAYYISLELVKATKDLAARIPRGYRNLADQINRASASVVLNLCEGANKFASGEKRQCFSRAQGECGEVAAAAELAVVLELVATSTAQKVIKLSGRVAAMLTGLIKRLRQPLDSKHIIK